MNFACLVLLSLFAGFGLGFTKFFLLGFLSAAAGTVADKLWIIQLVGSLITFGPCLAYVFAGPLASSSRKSYIMAGSGACTAALFLLGGLGGWPGSPWLYIFLVGFLIGIFNSAKNAAVPLEAAYGGRPAETINGTLNIVYIAGLLAGVPAGAELYEANRAVGLAIGTAAFTAAALAAVFIRYEREGEHLSSFSLSLRELKHDTVSLVARYPIYLFADPLNWGVASAASLAITAYIEDKQIGSAVGASLMSVYAAVGVAVGNGLAVKFRQRRYVLATLTTLGMALALMAIPLIGETIMGPVLNASAGQAYATLAATLAILGVLFGLSSNLVEADYLTAIYRDGKEGTGAALLSACTALFPFLLGGIMGLSIIFDWMSAVTQFLWLGFTASCAAMLIARLAVRNVG